MTAYGPVQCDEVVQGSLAGETLTVRSGVHQDTGSKAGSWSALSHGKVVLQLMMNGLRRKTWAMHRAS